MYKIDKKLWLNRLMFLGLFSLLITVLVPHYKTESKADEYQPSQTMNSEIEAANDVNKLQDLNQTPIGTEIKKEQQLSSTDFATVKGYALKIDSIGLNIPLGRTFLDSKGHLAVPADASKAAWYVKGPKPGAPGTALVTGHFDSSSGPGVFYNLEKVKVGDIVKVRRDDDTVASFKVDKIASYKQDNTFPWNEVYRTRGSAALRIITCDGALNPKTGLYSHNLVVYASLMP